MTGYWRLGLAANQVLTITSALLMIACLKDWPNSNRDALQASESSSFKDDIMCLASNKTYSLIAISYGLINTFATVYLYWVPHLSNNILIWRQEVGLASDFEISHFNFQIYWLSCIIISSVTGCCIGGFLSHKFCDKSPYASPLICGIPVLIAFICYQLSLFLDKKYFFLMGTPLNCATFCLCAISIPTLQNFLMVSNVVTVGMVFKTLMECCRPWYHHQKWLCPML